MCQDTAQKKKKKKKRGEEGLHDGLRDHTGVGTDHTCLKSLGNPPDPVRVPGEEIASKTDFGAVGSGDDFLFRRESEESGNGTKGLLSSDQLDIQELARSRV